MKHSSHKYEHKMPM